MIVLYIGSSESFAGKSLAALVLGRHFQKMGLKIGYFKPLGAFPVRVGNVNTDEGAAFIAEALCLEDPVEALCPVLLTTEMLNRIFAGAAPDFAGAIDQAFKTVSQNKDLLIIGGLGSVCSGGVMLGMSAAALMQRFDAKALLIGKYSDARSADVILASKLALGEGLLGAALNDVPRNQLTAAKEKVAPFLERQGLPVYGVIPRDHLLNSMSVRELAETTGSRILCCEEAADELVEHYTVGAMSVDAALRYFRRIYDKAVITGGDRADIQLAALETSTRCLILTGDLYPDSRILARAEEQGVPILLTREDTLTTVERIERMLGKLRIREAKKIARAEELVSDHMDIARFDADLGIGKTE